MEFRVFETKGFQVKMNVSSRSVTVRGGQAYSPGLVLTNEQVSDLLAILDELGFEPKETP